MSDEPFYSPNWKPPPPPPRQPKAGELLFEVGRGSDTYRFELRDHGTFGVEAQILLNGELYRARTFQDQPDFWVPARRLAIAWAEQQRKAMETTL